MSWKKIATWSALALLFLVVLAIGSGVLLLRSRMFQNYLLGKIERDASESLGTQVTARNFTLNLSPISAELFGVVVRGTGPADQPPLLTVDHINIGITILSVVRRSWNLNDIEIDHPVGRLLVDAQGNTNLPPRRSSQSRTNIFDLAIQHARLTGGELYYANRKIPVSADLRDLQFQSAYDSAHGGHYLGTVAYRDGQISYDGYAPMAHDLHASFDAARNELKVRSASINVAGSRLDLEATVRDYSNPVIDARYQAEIEGAQLRRVTHNPSVPSGMLRLRGSAHYEPAAARSLLATLSAEGELSSSALLMQTGVTQAEVRDLFARFDLRNGDLNVPEMRLAALGGRLTASASIQNLAGEQRGSLRAILRNISMAKLQSKAQPASLTPARLGGVIDADAEARWLGSIRNVVADLNATIHASVAPARTVSARSQPSSANPTAPSALPSQALPLDGVIHARYAGGAGELDISPSFLRTPQTRLDLQGKLSPKPGRDHLQFALESGALHELEALAFMLRPPTPGQPAQPLGISGTGSFRGSVQGSLANPQILGQLAANNVRVKGTVFRQVHAGVSAAPNQIALQHGQVELAPRGQLAFDLRSGLRKWHYSATAPLALTVQASQLPVAELAHAAGIQIPLSGTLNGDVAVQGTAQNPVGHGRLVVTQAAVTGQPVQSLNLSFQGTGETVDATLALRVPAGNADARLTYHPRQQEYQFDLQAPNLRLERLRVPRAHGIAVAGQLSITASGGGTIKDPALQATARIPELRMRGETVRDINLNATVANHEVRFTFASQAANTSIHAHGNVSLKDDYPIEAALDTQLIPLQPLFAMYMPAEVPDLQGQAEVHATLHGPLRQREQLEAHVTIPTLQVGYQDLRLAASAPLRADLAHGLLTLQPAEIKGSGTDLRFQGAMPLTSNASASLSMTGNVDLRLLRIIQPDLESSGQAQFDIHSQGTRSNPNVQGQVRIVNAGLQPAGAPVGLSNANGVLTLSNKRLDITQFQGEMGGGTVTARGGVTYDQGIKFDIGAAANGAQAVYQGIRLGMDAKLSLTGTPQAGLLTGQVMVNRLSATPDFDLSSLTNESGVTVVSAGTGVAQNIKLNINVQSSSTLDIVSGSLTARGTVNLRLVGTAADPVILGRAIVNSGDLLMFGNRYVLQSGTLDFINPVRTEPILNVVATTTVREYAINLRLQGPLDRLQINYSSDPALPPVDIINLLAFGQTLEAAGANPTSGTLGAQSVLASGISSEFTSRVQKVAGISHLSIDPALGGNGNGTQQNPGGRITVQQRVTGNLFVTFASDFTSTQNQVIQVEYHFTPRWSFSGVRDQNGGFGFDFRVRKEY